MNPALFQLMRLQWRGFLRRIVRGARSPRRAVFLILGVGVIILWLGPAVFSRSLLRHSHNAQLERSPERFAAVMPLALLGICVLTIVSSAGDKAVSFTPGEVDLLFPGPFTRRELLIYKLSKSGAAALLTGLLASIGLSIYASSWPACYAGVVLTLIFIQLFSTAGVLLGQTISRRAYSLVRRIVLICAVVVALLLARHWAVAHGGMQGVYALQNELSDNVLAPFEPFGRVITADSFANFGRNFVEAILIDAALLAVVVLLDANYLEAAMAASQRRHAQLQRIRGGSLLSGSVKGEMKWRLPHPPWLAGAGPIAWRQATSALRSAKGLLILLLIVAVGAGPLFATALQGTDVAQPIVSAVAWLTVLLSGMLKFDFRGDLDHMDGMKSLPLRPSAIALGQIAIPTLILTIAHVLLLGGVAAAAGSHRAVLVVAACLALPFNFLLMTTENLIFLLFPTRPAAASPGDFQVLGRQAAQLVLKAVTVLIGAVIAFGVAVPIYILTGGSLILLTLLAGAILAGEAIAMIPLVSWAFRRFDPSIDTPA